MLPEVHLCKQMSLMHVNLGGSKRPRHYSSSNHAVSTGERLEHSRSSPLASRRGGLIENDFRLLGKQKEAQGRDVFCPGSLRVLFRCDGNVRRIGLNGKSKKKRERKEGRREPTDVCFLGVPSLSICKERKRKRSFSAGSISLKCIH